MATALAVAGAAAGEPIPIAPGESLQSAIASAEPGDVLRLERGRHQGPIVLDKPLTLVGDEGAVLLGSGHGSVISITVPGVTVKGLTIRGSGIDVPAMDSAILVARTAPGAKIFNNRLEGNLFGVYLHGAGNKLDKQSALSESGAVINGRGDTPNRHDILTGSNPDGTRVAGKNCAGWTSSDAGTAIVGYHDRMGLRDDAPSKSWNSSHETRGCSQEAFKATGGDGLLYCFASGGKSAY